MRILIIVLTVIGLDMKMRFTLSGDIAKRAVFIKIMFFGLSLIRMKVTLVRADLIHRVVTLRIDKHIVNVAITTDTSNADSFLNYLRNPLLEALDFKYMSMSLTLGISGDAFLTAMALQAARMSWQAASSVIAGTQTVISDEKFVFDPSGDRISLRVTGIISLTIANIIIGAIRAARYKARAAARSGRRKRDNKQRTEADRAGDG